MVDGFAKAQENPEHVNSLRIGCTNVEGSLEGSNLMAAKAESQ